MGEEALNPSSLPQNSLRSLGPSPLRRLRRHLPQHSLRSLGEETETGLRSLGEETQAGRNSLMLGRGRYRTDTRRGRLVRLRCTSPAACHRS